MLLYINYIKPAERDQFEKKLVQISNSLGISNPNWLMQVFYSESKVNPAAYNPTGGASGLIQFMPDTAAGLGTTTAALRAMSATDQLDYVYRYFLPYKGRMNSYFDTYLVVFFPAAIGKSDDWVFSTSRLSASLIARQNPAININKDGQITVAEFKKYLSRTVPNGFVSYIFAYTTTYVRANPVKSGVVAAVVFGMTAYYAWIVYRHNKK